MKDGKLQWHPAFSAALHIELEDELDKIHIEDEHLLGKKPMQIDILVVKKDTDIPIYKNIGKIFRKHNIIEYKSPEDYLSINDFYKVYGYACFYQSDTEREMIELLEQYEEKKDLKWYEALMDVVVRANWKKIKEESQMCEALNELYEEIFADKIKNVREQGIEQGIEQGEERGIRLAKCVLKLQENGVSVDEIACQCEISREKVLEILK